MSGTGDPTIDALPVQTRELLAQAFGFYFTVQFATDHATKCVSSEADLRPAMFVNIGYAYELSCKAILAARGWDDRRLRRIGHDLEAGLREAEAVGLAVTDDARSHVALLSPPFLNHSLRYLTFGTVELPGDPLPILAGHLDAAGRLLLLPT